MTETVQLTYPIEIPLGAADHIKLLCTECDDDLFPQPDSEGFIDVCAMREWAANAVEKDPARRMVKMALGQIPEPHVRITLNGDVVPTEHVMELQAGSEGWIVLFQPNVPCSICNDPDHLKIPVLYGYVVVSV